MPINRNLNDEATLQKQNFVLDSIKQNRNRILFFLAFVLYALLTVLGTTDRDFFFENGVSFPLLNIKLPLVTFYMVAPLIIIFMHFNVMYLYLRHRKLMQRHNKIEKFYESIPLGVFDIATIEKGFVHNVLERFIFILVYLLPLFTLYIFWCHFNKYQNPLYSWLHWIYIVIDTIMIAYLIKSTRYKHLIFMMIPISLILVPLIQGTINNEQQVIKIFQKYLQYDKYDIREFIEAYYPRLELPGEYLVTYDYNQLKALQSLDKSKPLALLQPPIDLRNRSFKYANFNDAFLVRVNFEGANLYGATMAHAKLQGANLESANLRYASLQFANLQKANMRGTKLQGAYLQHAKLQEAKMKGANLQGADLMHANLQKADLYYAQLKGASLIDTRLQEANLTLAILARTNMRYAKLQKADLDTARLFGAEMLRVQLQGAYMRRAKLVGASLSDANLQGADLCNADLRGADLNFANLQGTNMVGANLRGAVLYDVKLQGAYLGGTKLQGTDMRNAKLQGAQSCKEGYSSFVERIRHYVNKKSDLSCVYHKPMSQSEKLDFQEVLYFFKKYVPKHRIKAAITKINKSTSALPDLKEAEIGSYTMNDAKRWIEEYKSAIDKKNYNPPPPKLPKTAYIMIPVE